MMLLLMVLTQATWSMTPTQSFYNHAEATFQESIQHFIETYRNEAHYAIPNQHQTCNAASGKPMNPTKTPCTTPKTVTNINLLKPRLHASMTQNRKKHTHTHNSKRIPGRCRLLNRNTTKSTSRRGFPNSEAGPFAWAPFVLKVEGKLRGGFRLSQLGHARQGSGLGFRI